MNLRPAETLHQSPRHSGPLAGERTLCRDWLCGLRSVDGVVRAGADATGPQEFAALERATHGLADPAAVLGDRRRLSRPRLASRPDLRQRRHARRVPAQPLQEELPDLVGILAFAAVAFLGVFLAADFVLRFLLDMVYWTCFALSFVFALVVNDSERPGFICARPHKSISVASVPIAVDVPIQHSGFDVKPPVEQPNRNRRRRRFCRSSGSGWRICRRTISRTTSYRR